MEKRKEKIAIAADAFTARRSPVAPPLFYFLFSNFALLKP
jgi:hypothetical protein